MARIVPGWQDVPEYDTGAVLRGFEKGARFRLAQQESQRQDLALQMDIMQALARMQQTKAAALEQAQQQANMGDAQAMASLSQMARAGSLDPDQAMVESMIQMRAGVQDPKALAVLDRAIAQTTSAMKAVKERKGAEDAIKRAATNGWADEAMLTQRLQAGESPQALVQELQKVEAEKIAGATAQTEAQDVLTHADALIKSTQPGFRRRSAEIRRQAFLQDIEGQQKPGEAQKFLAALQKDLLETDEDRLKREKAERLKRQQQLGPQAPAPGLEGMTTGERTKQLEKEPGQFWGMLNPGRMLGIVGEEEGYGGGPKIPPLSGKLEGPLTKQARAGKGAQVGQSAGAGLEAQIAGLVEKTKSPRELREAIQASGIPLTAETQALTRAILERRRTNAQAVAGADR